MSEKATKKYIKATYGTPIIIRQCEVSTLMRDIEEDYYSTRVEGWACDYKYFPGIDKIICWGDAPIGRNIKDYSIVREYEQKAKEEEIKYNSNEGIYYISDDIKNDSYMYSFEVQKMVSILKDKKYRLMEELLQKIELI